MKSYGKCWWMYNSANPTDFGRDPARSLLSSIPITAIHYYSAQKMILIYYPIDRHWIGLSKV